MPAQTIVGRAAELVRLEELLDAIVDGPVALVLEGDIGIGKTTLWQAGLAAAARRSYHVLVCRPIECETQFGYAALGDLLADVPDSHLAELPEPQRRALEVASLRLDPDDSDSSPRAVALGLLGVLRTSARDRPTVVGIDDVQWLDQPSESALSFLLRRLRDAPVGVIITRRGADGPAPLDLERALPEDRLLVLRVGSLEPAELDVLLEGRLDVPLSKRTRTRLSRRSGGNPFFALELARALGPPAEGKPGGDDPIPASLRELVGARLALLAEDARDLVRIASALSRPTATLLDAVTGNDTGQAVEAAVRAGVVELDGERVRFSHPLLASVAYAETPAEELWRLHARLAEILDDPEERGRHLALSTDPPDAGVASALDEAARRARVRGAPGAAAELSEQARRFTPEHASAEGRRRGIEAAERHFEAGDVDRARALLAQLIEESPPGDERARALVRLGWVRAHMEGFRVGESVFRAARAEPVEDVRLRVEIEEGLAWCVHTTMNVAAAQAHARAALELAEELGDAAVLAGALSHVAFLASLSGHGLALATIERALALEHAAGWSQILGRPDWIHALLLEWSGALLAARERFESLYQNALDRGDEHSLPFILFHLSRVELLSGRWSEASEHATECHETTAQSGQAGELAYALAIEALVAAHLGHVEAAAAKIEEGLRRVEPFGVQPAGLELLATSGFLDLSRGELTPAERTFRRLAEIVQRTGLREPALFRWHGDAIEVQLALGRREEAQTILAELDRLGDGFQRPWVLVVATRCRALLRATLGELDEAERLLHEALELHERLEEPFERARTLLALGSVKRRNRQKRAARDALADALAIFDELGAALWSEKARTELARVGGRPSFDDLTATEERVAELIASGLTYRETADAMFISPRTVQWNLSKIYRKLGIRTRAELPARLAGRQVEQRD